jgi:hypothetical protein
MRSTPGLGGQGSLPITPITGDYREEQCSVCSGAASPDHQCGAAFVAEEELQQLGEEPDPSEEPYVLEVECARDEHDPHTLWCCTVVSPHCDPKLPVPAPARVYHPNYKCIGLLSLDHSDVSSSSYGLTVNGEMDYLECFSH